VISQPILSINKLSLTNSERILFKNISFELFQGEILAIMGPSGIGKSMLSRAIAGFLPPDILVDGSIQLNGSEVSQLAMLQRTQRQRPAVIFQDPLKALNPLASVEQQLCLALTGNKTRLDPTNREIVVSLLAQLGFVDPEMALAQHPSQLSGGQRQRICIAIALLGRADLIIADEPTSALDSITEAEILNLFHCSIQQRNISGLLITHNLSIALACDKVLIIADNTMVIYGSPREVIKQSQHPFCCQIAQSPSGALLSEPIVNKQHKHESVEIRFEQVSVHYYSKPRLSGGKPVKALEQLNLTIAMQNLAIVGPSGAGKSTLIELLFGLRQPSSGEVYICGYPLSRISSRQRQALCQHIQLIPQEPQSSLNPFYTVSQILLESLNNIGISHDQNKKVEQALRYVGLDLSLLEQNPQKLSVGQAQRVAIARALIVEPRILVADEPTSSLDPVSRRQILDLLTQIQQTHQMRLILVTHDLSAAQTLCDDILVLDKGRVVEQGASQSVVNNPKHLITRALLSAQLNNSQLTKTIREVSYAS
jgi:ABC-type glutathione transport system ATPase component